MADGSGNAKSRRVPVVVRSQIVSVARTLRPGVRRVLRLSDGLLILVDFIVGAANVYLDDSDPRPVGERMSEWVSTSLEPGDQIQVDEVTTAMDYFSNAPEGWIGKLQAHLTKPFILRLLGAATYQELTNAAKQDTAVVVRVIQRLALQLRPMALALEDAITLVSQQELAASGLGSLPVKVLQMMFNLEEQATTELLPRLGIEIDPAIRPTNEDMSAIMEELRVLVAEDSIEQVQRIGQLKNKISGARHALDGSDDGVSQAAHSLVELIDRSFREAYPKDVVLRWIADVFPDSAKEYTYEAQPSGELRPTKLAEALCFTAGGATRGDAGAGIHRVVALALIGARSKLQKFKHNDDPSNEEREEIRQIMRGVEGAMIIGIRIGFGLAQMVSHDADGKSAEALALTASATT